MVSAKDYYVLNVDVGHTRYMPLSEKIVGYILEVMENEAKAGKLYLPQGSIILKVLVNYPDVKEHYMKTKSVSIARKALQKLVKMGVVVRFKTPHDLRRNYYALSWVFEEKLKGYVVGKRHSSSKKSSSSSSSSSPST